MPAFCAVVGCGSRGDRDYNSFYRIPAVPKKGSTERMELRLQRRIKWITALRRSDLTETKLKYAHICDRHFISGGPADTADINHPDWIPTQNMGYGTKPFKKKKSSNKKIKFRKPKQKKKKKLPIPKEACEPKTNLRESLLVLAKTYIGENDYSTAISLIDRAVVLPTTNDDNDETYLSELLALQFVYEEHRT